MRGKWRPLNVIHISNEADLVKISYKHGVRTVNRAGHSSPNACKSAARSQPDYVRLGYSSVGAVIEGDVQCGPSPSGKARAAAAGMCGRVVLKARFLLACIS